MTFTYVKSITMYMFPSSDCQATYHHITSKSEDLHLETAGIKETLSKPDTENLFMHLCTVSPIIVTKQLQLMQNAAARVLTKTRKMDQITPVLNVLNNLYTCSLCVRGYILKSCLLSE